MSLTRAIRAMGAVLASALMLTLLVGTPAQAAYDTKHPYISLSAATRIGSGWATYDAMFAAANVTGGVAPDILAVTPARKLVLYPGASATGYSSPRTIGGGWGTPLIDYQSIDFTGDGLADILTRHSDGRMALYTNRGGNSFRGPTWIGTGWNIFRDWTVVQAGPNKRPTIYAIHTNGSLYRYEGNGKGRWNGGGVVIGGGWASVTSIHGTADIDGNGSGEVLAIDKNGVLRLYMPVAGSTSMKAWRLGVGFAGYDSITVLRDTSGTMHLRGTAPDGALMDWRMSWNPPKPPAPPKPPEANAVFVYGTLLSGQPNNYRLSGDYSSKSRTSMAGVAPYRMSGYNWPWAVVRSGYTTQGEVYWLKPGRASAAIADLDRLEQYNPSKPTTNQSYIRVKRTMANGFSAWVYVAGPRTASWMMNSGSVIPSVDWLRR